MPRKTYPPQMRAQAVADYRAGRPLEDIAATHRIAAKTVLRWADEAGVQRRRAGNGSISAEIRAALVAEYRAEACSVASLARKCGVSETAARMWVRCADDSDAAFKGKWVRDGLIWRAA